MVIKNKLLQVALISLLVRAAVFVLPVLFWQLLGRQDILIQNIADLWNRWDAPHFLYIAENGYTNVGDPANFIVFPPLFPLTVKLLTLITRNYVWSAIILANIFFVAGAVVFYHLVAKIWHKDVAQKALFLLLIFPTSYFFSAPYTESLFFFLSITSFYLAYKKLWLWAGILAGLSFLTRHPGIFLLPALWIYWYHSDKKIKNLLFITVPFLLCVSMYLFINWKVYGHPFMFRYILENHWQKRFALPWISLQSSWRVALGKMDEYAIQVGWWEAIPATLGFLGIPIVVKFLKKPHWNIWYILTILFITSTSFLLSTSRYLVSVIPLFVFLGIISHKSKIIYYILSFVFAGLLTYFSMRFVSGMWAF